MNVRPSTVLLGIALIGGMALHSIVVDAKSAHAKPGGGRSQIHDAPVLWSSLITSGARGAGIYENTVVVERSRPSLGRSDEVLTEGLDASTGKLLWRRDGASPTAGDTPFLAFNRSLDRIDIRTGRSKWRSPQLCRVAHATPTIAVVSGSDVDVGCSSGEIFALNSSTGRILASAYPIKVVRLDRIVPLAFNTLDVSGYDDVDMVTRSAILNDKTLSTALALGPDVSLLAYDGQDVLTVDSCCRGTHDDNWPATIQRFSIKTRTLISRVDLHPYRPALPVDKSQPGAGTVLLAGMRLYVSTHSGLFLYDLRILNAQPRMLYRNLGAQPVLIRSRYFFITEGPPLNPTRTSLFDARATPARVVWSDNFPWLPQPPEPGPAREIGSDVGLRTNQNQAALVRLSDMTLWRIDDDCALQASNERFAFVYCPPAGPPPRLPARVQMYQLP